MQLAHASAAMELAQMIVQAMWDSESPLKQLPHVGADALKRCKDAGIASIFDLMDVEVRPPKSQRVIVPQAVLRRALPTAWC